MYMNINNVSNPRRVNQLSNKIYGKGVELSTRKNKKYMIVDSHGKYIHFGDVRYEDFTKHRDDKRRLNYLNRATHIKGDWKKNKYSPNSLAINLLWNNTF